MRTVTDLPLEVYKGVIFDRLRAMGLEDMIETLEPEFINEAAAELRLSH